MTKRGKHVQQRYYSSTRTLGSTQAAEVHSRVWNHGQNGYFVNCCNGVVGVDTNQTHNGRMMVMVRESRNVSFGVSRHLDIVQYLQTSFTSCLYRQYQPGYEQEMNYRKKLGATLEAKDGDGWAAVQHAIQRGHLDIVKYLVDRFKVGMDAKNSKGYTALRLAVENGHIAVVKYLIEEHHFAHEAKSNYGYTALHRASIHGRFEIVQYLFEKCHCDKEAKNDDGCNALHFVSIKNHLEIVKYFIESCHVDQEANDNKGWTALHCDCFFGHWDIVKYLLETVHVKIAATTYDGQSAHDLSVSNNTIVYPNIWRQRESR